MIQCNGLQSILTSKPTGENKIDIGNILFENIKWLDIFIKVSSNDFEYSGGILFPYMEFLCDFEYSLYILSNTELEYCHKVYKSLMVPAFGSILYLLPGKFEFI